MPSNAPLKSSAKPRTSAGRCRRSGGRRGPGKRPLIAPSNSNWRSMRSGSTKSASRISMISSSRPESIVTRSSSPVASALSGALSSAVGVTSIVVIRSTGSGSPSTTTRARKPSATSRTAMTTERTPTSAVRTRLEFMRELLEGPPACTGRTRRLGAIPIVSLPPCGLRQPVQRHQRREGYERGAGIRYAAPPWRARRASIARSTARSRAASTSPAASVTSMSGMTPRPRWIAVGRQPAGCRDVDGAR